MKNLTIDESYTPSVWGDTPDGVRVYIAPYDLSLDAIVPVIEAWVAEKERDRFAHITLALNGEARVVLQEGTNWWREVAKPAATALCLAFLAAKKGTVKP